MSDPNQPTEQSPVQLSDRSPPVVPPELRKLDSKTLEVAEQYFLQAKFHSGPLPPAEDLAAFEEASPGAAAQIIAMARAEQENRHYVTKAQVDAIGRGQWLSITAYVSTMGACVWIVSMGAAAAAATIGGAAVGVFGGAFLLSKHLEKKDRKAAEPEEVSDNNSKSIQIKGRKQGRKSR